LVLSAIGANTLTLRRFVFKIKRIAFPGISFTLFLQTLPWPSGIGTSFVNRSTLVQIRQVARKSKACLEALNASTKKAASKMQIKEAAFIQ
jgi:hypothetical protein